MVVVVVVGMAGARSRWGGAWVSMAGAAGSGECAHKVGSAMRPVRGTKEMACRCIRQGLMHLFGLIISSECAHQVDSEQEDEAGQERDEQHHPQRKHVPADGWDRNQRDGMQVPLDRV